jgi:hypothetical protein
MFILLQKLNFDGKLQICLSTLLKLLKLSTGNAFRLQWYQNHSNFHCYQQIQSFLFSVDYFQRFLDIKMSDVIVMVKDNSPVQFWTQPTFHMWVSL